MKFVFILFVLLPIVLSFDFTEYDNAEPTEVLISSTYANIFI